MKKYIYLSILSLILCACSPVKQILTGGNIKEKSFNEQIPFAFDYGVPIVKVSINGKVYNFMFDTGAATVISPEIANSLKLKAITKDKTSDSQGNSNQQEFVVIPQMKIGNLNFENIGAVVIDLKTVFEMKCMGFDGIIGANQMAKAIWQIDYQHKILTATNNLSNLAVADAQILDFIPKGNQKTPVVVVKIGKQISYATFDTGATIDFNFTLNNYKTELTNFETVQTIGGNSTGIYGTGKNATTSYVKIPSFNIGSINLKNQIPIFTENPSNLIGNSLFKKYRVVIDWSTNKIYMANEIEIKDAKLESFGIGFRFINNKPIIAKIFKNTEAEKIGLLLNDELIAIDGKDTTSFTESEACHYAFNNILNGKTEVVITVLRNGVKLDFKLKKASLLG